MRLHIAVRPCLARCLVASALLATALSGCETPPEPVEEVEDGLSLEDLVRLPTRFERETSASNTADATAAGTPRVDLGYLKQGLVVEVNSCSGTSAGSLLRIARVNGNNAAPTDAGVKDSSCRKVSLKPGGLIISSPVTGQRITFTVPQDGFYTVLSGCAGDSQCSARVAVGSRTRLEERWAPAIYQDVWPEGWWTRSFDYLTKINFDGEYNALNNDSSVYSHALPAYVYTSKVETETHWFIGYYFYHPRDRTHARANDLEGVLMSIRKEGLFGRTESWVTQAHGFAYSAMDRNTLPECAQSPHRNMTWGHGQPAVFVDARGHAVYDCEYDGQLLGDWKTWAEADCGDNDGVLYTYKGGTVDIPGQTCGDGSATFRNAQPCGYGLIALEESGGKPRADVSVDQGLWHLRDEPQVYQDHNTFTGGEANPPWQWTGGRWLADPAALFRDLHWSKYKGNSCRIAATASNRYTSNPYIEIETHQFE